ncbi:MAG: hypothetical protein QF685_09485 [Verrucomicrobiota bacterium]|nr:hypothetical protein [Verrucomicrobiota bacterium]
MGRFISIISGILALSLFLPGCSREVVEKTVNPRVAKSGEKLTKEEGIPVASDSSESIPDEDKRSGNITTGDAKSVARSAAQETPALNRAQMAQLVQRARSGNANAQVDLGNVFFEGKGVPVNKQAAEYWWRLAAAKQHLMAIENLQMLYTKPEEGVSFFGASGKGERFVYLVDSSGSMGMGMRFQKEKKELIRSIRTLRPHMKFTVIFYDDVPHHNGPIKLFDVTKENIRLMTQWVADRRLGNNNYMIPALKGAMTLKPDTIFLLSDGMPDFTPERVCADVKKLNPGQKVVINAVSLHDPEGRLLMKRIAKENKGEFRYVEPDPTLEER